MTTYGVIREWSSEEGWGVIDSDATPGGCWVHFSAVRVAGFRTFTAGSAVEFTYVAAPQTPFDFRAEAAWPTGEEPVDDAIVVRGPSAAYESHLSLRFDEPD
ncbi:MULTISPECIES: cold-shock protein [unclassified Nocardioides]|uniref:cold-shock protein n=1 Tax=unclassified Nocardioides TaxID=2615069 RepID=UPI0009E8BA29|nr:MULTISPECIES: cold shock domain-containing protein [unclassified Nocardioides]